MFMLAQPDDTIGQREACVEPLGSNHTMAPNSYATKNTFPFACVCVCGTQWGKTVNGAIQKQSNMEMHRRLVLRHDVQLSQFQFDELRLRFGSNR